MVLDGTWADPRHREQRPATVADHRGANARIRLRRTAGRHRRPDPDPHRDHFPGDPGDRHRAGRARSRGLAGCTPHSTPPARPPTPSPRRSTSAASPPDQSRNNTGGELMPSRYVEDIAGLGMADAEEAGGKGANMGEMVAAGLAGAARVRGAARHLSGVDGGRGGGRRTQHRPPRGDAALRRTGPVRRDVRQDAGAGAEGRHARRRARAHPGRLPGDGAECQCRRAVVGHRRGRRRCLVRRDERDVHQHLRRAGPDRRGAALLGVAVRRRGWSPTGPAAVSPPTRRWRWWSSR